MSDFLFGLVMAVVFLAVGYESAKPELEVSTYNMHVELKVKHITLEEAGNLEAALREWFSEMSVIQVTIEPDTTK